MFLSRSRISPILHLKGSPSSIPSPFHSRFITMASSHTAKNQINLLRGWPNPSLLPIPHIANAAHAALSDPAVSVPGLLYGPDPGYQPLREEIAKWMGRFYGGEGSEETPHSSKQGLPGQAEGVDAERICITGGASQNLACVLQVYSDPLKTRVWMVAPCYFLACRIFGDAGLRVRAVGEGEEGVDLEKLERGLKEAERADERDRQNVRGSCSTLVSTGRMRVAS
jgi:DNA-binding transcriptional MocR family regulator